ncbi:carbohydrate ABC transporter permease [Alloscardovia venturai]|uniref:Carbohydrate ABC transporter permease n=1 Tax=Alloscardovia venturai TaxID=1769421 RepID=A0ABW2Y803_9BIFI
MIVPIVFLIIISFTDFNLKSLFTGNFGISGFNQYTKIFHSASFFKTLWRTVAFMVALVVPTILIGMFMAHFMTMLGKVMKWMLTLAFIFAWAIPNVAAATVWNWMFQPRYGIVNIILTRLKIFGNVQDLSWATNPMLAFVCIWLLIVWQAVPYVTLTLFAATEQIPPTIFEAARVDGAGSIRAYWSIEFPLLLPVISITTVLSVIWDFNVFNQIWLISQGGPDEATSTLAIYTYKQAFIDFNLSRGAAISIIAMLILLALTSVYVIMLMRNNEGLS